MTAGLLDTSTVILLPRLGPVANALPDRSLISAVTLAELTVGPQVATGREAALRQQRLQQAEADLEVLPFDADAARAFGLLAASLRKAGRKTSARAFDSLIAATAISRGLPLHTCNPRDFSGMDGLDLRPVPHPGEA